MKHVAEQCIVNSFVPKDTMFRRDILNGDVEQARTRGGIMRDSGVVNGSRRRHSFLTLFGDLQQYYECTSDDTY